MARKNLKSLKTCNQICFFILKIFRLSLQRQSKKWKAWESHMLGTSKKGKNPKFEDLKICSLESYFLLEANKWSVWSLEEFFFFKPLENLWNFVRYQPVGLDNLEQFSFLIQEEILSELYVCFQSTGLQGGLYSKVVM